jgi:FlaG/FlaF family flagellin (archaellin)
MRKKIKRKIPATHQTSTAAPSIASVLGYLRAHFDEDDLDVNDEDVELSLESEEDEDQSSDSDEEDFSARPP